MDEIITPERKERREALKGMNRITISDPLDTELLEDLATAAPGVQLLYLNVFDDTSFDISLLSDLKELLIIEIRKGFNLQQITLEGIQEFDVLTSFEINVNPEKSIDELDLSPFAGHPSLSVVTVACPTKRLNGLDALNSIPNLVSIGLYSLDTPELDLSALSGCKGLTSIYLGDMGPETPTEPYRITLPRDIPLKVLEMSECYGDDTVLEIDFSIMQDIIAMDSLKLTDCNLTSFDLKALDPLARIGRIDLSENKISHLDITPILEKPTFTEQALGEAAFVLDADVIIQIDKKMENELPRILKQPDKVIDDHDGEFAIEYEFGHQWLQKLLDSHTVEWI